MTKNKKESKLRHIINMILASLFLIKKEDRKKVLDEVNKVGEIAKEVEANINAIAQPVGPKRRASRKPRQKKPVEAPKPSTPPSGLTTPSA